MCSWCWGFSKTWGEIRHALNDLIEIHYVLGGLALDSREPMPIAMQEALQDTWRNIQVRVPGTQFNFDFWKRGQPRRSTYPACRAVIAAKAQVPMQERGMIKTIQHAYYLDARNPSDDRVLIELAGDLGLNTQRFAKDLNSEETHRSLHRDVALGQRLGARGFPSLVLVSQADTKLLQLDYNSSTNILRQII